MVDMKKIITENYAIYNGDCMDVMSEIGDGKIHMSIYSPPFGGLYNYSSDARDMSNCLNYEEFMVHYGFCVEEISRITMSGRISCVHCCDIQTSNNGNDAYTDFPGDIIRLHERHGFRYVARHTIWKEPLWVRNRTMMKNLAHKTIIDDATLGGVAHADYLLVFRKKGTNPVPVQNQYGLTHYPGEEPIPSDIRKYEMWTGDQKENKYSHFIWRHLASCIWDDIRMDRVLPFMDCKEDDDEKHVHPMQLDINDRAIMLRTNPGETVFTPFMGVGSEVYSAVALGRRGVGVELKASYFRQAAANMEACEPGIYDSKIEQRSFDFGG